METDGVKFVISVDDKGTPSIEKMATAFDKVDKSADRAAKSANAWRTKADSAWSSTLGLYKQMIALAGAYGLVKVARSFLDAARATESYSLRLSILLRSQEQGARMFKEMEDYAGRVPFTFQAVMESATTLAGIMKGGVAEVTKWMPLIGDLAAVTGLSFEQTTSQFVRMYSAGAAAADLFRERGVLSMLGFQAGATYSAEETRKKIWESWSKMDSQFKGATDKLAKTWDGTMSMIEDKWFKMRNAIMEAGVYDAMKEALHGIDKAFEDWLNANREFIRLNVPVYMESVKTGLIAIFDVLKESAGLMDKFVRFGEALGAGMGAAIYGPDTAAGVNEQRIEWLETKTKNLRIEISKLPKESLRAKEALRELYVYGRELHLRTMTRDTTVSEEAKERNRENMYKALGIKERKPHELGYVGAYKRLPAEAGKGEGTLSILGQMEKEFSGEKMKESFEKEGGIAKWEQERRNFILTKLYGPEVDLHLFRMQEMSKGSEQQLADEEEISKLRVALWEEEVETARYAYGKEQDYWKQNYDLYLRQNEVLLNETEKTVEQQKKMMGELTEFAVQAARNMESAMADFFFNVMQGKMDDLVGDFRKMIDRMLANLLASGLTEFLFGSFGALTKEGMPTGGFMSNIFGKESGGWGAVGALINGIGSVASLQGGGVISEPVVGVGLHSGRGYTLGEAGSERVSPMTGEGGGGGAKIVNIVDPSIARIYLNSPEGRDSILNIISSDPVKFRRMLRSI